MTAGHRGRCMATAMRGGVGPICLAVFVCCWAGLAIEPRYRFDWLLENLPTFLVVPAITIAYARGIRFSDRAYLQGTALLLLHTLASHYTYSEVPIGEWLRPWLGGRNQFDRLVHLAFGLLMLRPIAEASFRRGPGTFSVRERVLACGVVAWWAAIYEILEWLIAIVVDPKAGAAFLGAQGDPWDAQKDLALGIGGALVAAAAERWAARSTDA